jgi:hypothetical protein
MTQYPWVLLFSVKLVFTSLKKMFVKAFRGVLRTNINYVSKVYFRPNPLHLGFQKNVPAFRPLSRCFSTDKKRKLSNIIQSHQIQLSMTVAYLRTSLLV